MRQHKEKLTAALAHQQLLGHARAGASCARRIDQIAALDDRAAHTLQDAVEALLVELDRTTQALGQRTGVE